MPKMRTRMGATKRFVKTRRGKIKMHRPFASHKLTGKSAKRKRHLRQTGTVSPKDVSRIKRMIRG